jgi:hypothetical protein
MNTDHLVLGPPGSASADPLVRVTDPKIRIRIRTGTKMSRIRNTDVSFPPCAGHIPAGYDEHSGVPGGVTALPPAAGLPSSAAAHRTGTG